MNSSILRWPSRQEVERALRAWTAEQGRRRPQLLRLGYLGSYARGDWGVGSDLDLVAVVRESSLPFERRSLDWDLSPLPVPAEIVVFTRTEWEALQAATSPFAHVLRSETVWTLLPEEDEKPPAAVIRKA